MKIAIPSAIGVAISQRKDRRIQRAPDERQRAEFAGDRIPEPRLPEAQTEPADGRHRLQRQHDADRRDDRRSGSGRTGRCRSGNPSRRMCDCHGRLLCVYDLSQGPPFRASPPSRGAARTQLGAILLAVGERPFHEVDHRFRLRLVLGVFVSSSHVNEEIGYTPLPGALVIETRKSAGIWLAADVAAAVTDSTEALLNSPAMFWTDP